MCTAFKVLTQQPNMMRTYSFVFFIVATCMVHAEKRNTASIMSTIKNLHVKLYKSIQKEANAIKSATFETQCFNSGCFYNIASNNKQSKKADLCDVNVVLKLDNLAMKIDKLGNIPRTTECKKGFKRYQNRCYKYISTKVNFFEAEMFCRTQQSSLADIGNAKEDQWFKQFMTDSRAWVGGTDIAKQGKWKWISTGLPLNFTNWSRGEPGNAHEHCICYDKPSAWHDYPCDSKFAFICKY